MRSACTCSTRCSGAITLLATALAGCVGGASNDPGLDALLRVDSGSFFRGALPADGDGPAVLGTFLTQTSFPVGKQDKSFSGVLAGGSVAAVIALDGDVGYWLVPASLPPPEAPEALGFDARLSFSAQLEPGAHSLRVWAVDTQGSFGASLATAFQLTARELPEGELVVALSWDTESDLDLHLLTPGGVEVYHGNVNSWQRSGVVVAGDETWRAGGLLDFDSNADCVIDGRREENIVWTVPPPSGSYAVRVDTPSLCGTAGARWQVEVWRAGALLGSARGFSTGTASRFGHDRGAGVLALEFQVP